MRRQLYSLVLAVLAACSDDGSETACEAEQAFLAAHRACSTAADCTIVGACSGGSTLIVAPDAAM
jgi:hypothetical protein